jgi:hypothetical protein
MTYFFINIFMRIFSKKTFKNFKNICEAASTDLPKAFTDGSGEQVNTQTNYYHGQGGMSMYNLRTIRDAPQWLYTGVPAYTTPNGVVIIPPDPRTGIFLPNMLPGVNFVNLGSVYDNFYTFDWNSMGGFNSANAYNLLILNMLNNPYWIQNIESGWALNNVDLLIAGLTSNIREAIQAGTPGFSQGDNERFANTFFADQATFFDFMAWWGQSFEDIQDGTLNWNEIEFPDISQS